MESKLFSSFFFMVALVMMIFSVVIYSDLNQSLPAIKLLTGGLLSLCFMGGAALTVFMGVDVLLSPD